MSTTARDSLPFPGRARERLGGLVRSVRRPHPELIGLVALSALLYLWALSRNGWANTYYTAAVRSMSGSWHDFLYGSFDAGGVMTVNKPPLALWVQALSVRMFGFDSLSILVPQALMGVVGVVLVYDLTRRRWGRWAGSVAGLAMATTPIAVAIFRHNNPDALLILCSTAALWLTLRALEDGRTRWLVWAGVFVGLGFEAKMAAALLVLPGLLAAWMWIAPRGRMPALRSALWAGAAMVAVGGAWPLLMALTPASDRPWISGTADNSIWSLIWGYNGLGRIDGQAGAPTGGGGGGGFFGGDTGPLRLLNASLGGQVGWLIGMAVVGGVGIAIASRLRRADPRTGWIIAVGGAFVVPAIAFSMASGIFHPYYVSLLAPFTAALVGGTVGQVLEDRRLLRPLGAAAIGAGVLSTLIVLHNTAGQPGWIAPRGAAGRHLRGGRARPGRDRSHPPRRSRRGRVRADGRAPQLVVPDARPRDQRHLPGRRAPGELRRRAHRRRLRRRDRVARPQPAPAAADSPRRPAGRAAGPEAAAVSAAASAASAAVERTSRPRPSTRRPTGAAPSWSPASRGPRPRSSPRATTSPASAASRAARARSRSSGSPTRWPRGGSAGCWPAPHRPAGASATAAPERRRP